MDFIFYDIGLLILFAIFISIFLYTRKKNLKREGLLFLYKTSWGINLINKIGTKYKKTIKFLEYISISIGYILMALIVYLFGKMVYIYIAYPAVVRAIKVPPITPLIPYIDRLAPSLNLPPFYFIYWIVILAIIAITHELAHGIFAAYNKVKIKTTGFGFFPFFLPVFLAAFVELDEEKMKKKNIFSKMSVLSAGTFANVLTAIFFFIILFIFFSFAFTPSGVVFDNYAYTGVAIANITSINGLPLFNTSIEKIINLSSETKLNQLKTKNKSYVVTRELLEEQINNQDIVMLYYDAPAINIGLAGIITYINETKITSKEQLKQELDKYSPNDIILIKTTLEEGRAEYTMVLGEHPNNKTMPWIGIGFKEIQRKGIIGRAIQKLSSFKDPNIHYEPRYDGFSLFIYNLLWWIVLISISVALVNMLPAGIFDGGQFFYLTILAITKSEKKARKAFAFSTYLLLFLLFLIMIFWVIGMFV